MNRLACILALLLTGCAATTRKTDASGHVSWRIEGNYARLDIVDKTAGFELHGIGVDHSTPTTAVLNGANEIVSTVATAAVTGIATHGASNAVRFLAPAAPVGVAAVHKKAAATPAPKP